MMLERSYLPAKKFLTLTRELLEQKPLYDLFSQEFNQTIRVANEEFFATVAKSKDARQLQIIEGSPVLSLRRTTYNTENEIIEFTLSVARADQNSLSDCSCTNT